MTPNCKLPMPIAHQFEKQLRVCYSYRWIPKKDTSNDLRYPYHYPPNVAATLFISSFMKLKEYILPLQCPLKIPYVKHTHQDPIHMDLMVLALRLIGPPPNTNSAAFKGILVATNSVAFKGFLVATYALGLHLLLELKFVTFNAKCSSEIEAARV